MGLLAARYSAQASVEAGVTAVSLLAAIAHDHARWAEAMTGDQLQHLIPIETRLKSGRFEVERWHSRQWHMEMRDGSPSIVRLNCPQLQAARRMVMDQLPGCLPASVGWNSKHKTHVCAPGPLVRGPLGRKIREAHRWAASIINVLWVPGVFLRLFRLGE